MIYFYSISIQKTVTSIAMQTKINTFFDWVILTHLFQCTLSLHPENIRKPKDFLMFSEGTKRVHCEQMG